MSTEKEILEGNKLIAEFIGGVFCDYPDNIFPSEVGYRFRIKIPATARETTDGYWWNEKNLAFHTSWDWLMPVVEKIENDNDYYVEIVKDWVNIYRFNDRSGKILGTDIFTQSKIHGVWKSVIDFIKWYNNQTPTL